MAICLVGGVFTRRLTAALIESWAVLASKSGLNSSGIDDVLFSIIYGNISTGSGKILFRYEKWCWGLRRFS